MSHKNNDDKITILLIADNFDPHFAPITVNTAWGKWHLGTTQLLDLALNWISLVNTPHTPDILIFSATLNEDDLTGFQKKWAFNFKSFKTVYCQNCASVGQIVREVHSRGLIPHTDFMFIDNLATFCSSTLSTQIDAFRNIRKKEKNCVMSLLYSRQISGDDRFVGFEANTKKLVIYHGNRERPIPEITQDMFTKGVTIRGDLAPCGIALCSVEVLGQFVDNFDYENFDQVVREILANEDVLCQTIHVDILPENVVAFTATDYGSLLRAQRLLIHRWCYPLTYDRLPARVFDNQVPLRYHRKHVYVPRNEEEPSNAQGTILGRGCSIATSAQLLDVTMGENGSVGPEVQLSSVIVGKNFKIGGKSIVEGAVIGDNVTIGDRVFVGRKSVIGSNVVIPDDAEISSNSAVMATTPPEDNDDIKCTTENGYYLWKLKDEPSGYFWRRSQSFNRTRRSRHASSNQSITSCHNSISMDGPPEQEEVGIKGDVILDTELFFKTFLAETKESMLGTFESGKKTDPAEISKLILEINSSKLANNVSQEDVAKEINSSKLANNVSQEDVAKGVFLSFLSMPPVLNRKWKETEKLFEDWSTVWKNYYRPTGNKIQLLVALEETALENENVMAILPNLVYKAYYDLDDFEDAVLSWHEELPENSPIRQKVQPVIDLINESESEEEETEQSEEDA
uniref:W2 domain-containing protein n=1 Tax=Panagrolaimus sp. JU765 TaxID=591449 RepID=A0AC34QNI4_9BILA